MNEELKSIYLADQADRGDDLLPGDIVQRDERRRRRVQEMLSSGDLQTGDDFFHAAMVFQHGHRLEDYRLAGDLARTAVELGQVGQAWWCSAAWLVAAAQDRWLMRQGKPQKYGTQFFRAGPHGPLELWEVDPATTDEERAALNVPPLAAALGRADGRVHRAEPPDGPV
jgi:hypothetical protein